MSLHLSAQKGEIASTVLMPGDPLRAEFIANHYLDQPKKHNYIRNTWGYTGFYKGEKISIQSSGMGMPSMCIYANELIQEYKVTKIIRMGSCGALQPQINMKDIIIAQAASTDSAIPSQYFGNHTVALTPYFQLLQKAVQTVKRANIPHHVGNILTSDLFYYQNPDYWKRWQTTHLAIEMETAALYLMAMQHRIQALSLLTVSDHFITQEKLSAKERQISVSKMIETCLTLATCQ